MVLLCLAYYIGDVVFFFDFPEVFVKSPDVGHCNAVCFSSFRTRFGQRPCLDREPPAVVFSQLWGSAAG